MKGPYLFLKILLDNLKFNYFKNNICKDNGCKVLRVLKNKSTVICYKSTSVFKNIK